MFTKRSLDMRSVCEYYLRMVTIDFVRGWAVRAWQVDPSMNELVTTSDDQTFLKEIEVFLRAERIFCTLSQVGDRWRLRIRDLESLLNWRDKIGFSRDPKRASRLATIIDNLESKNV